MCWVKWQYLCESVVTGTFLQSLWTRNTSSAPLRLPRRTRTRTWWRPSPGMCRHSSKTLAGCKRKGRRETNACQKESEGTEWTQRVGSSSAHPGRFFLNANSILGIWHCFDNYWQLLFFCWMCFRNFPSSQYNFLLTIFEKTWSYALLTSMCGLKRLCVLTLECSITYLSKNFYIQNRINKLSLMEINLILLILFCAAREVQMKQGIEKTGLPALRLSLLATYSEAVDRKGNKSPI